MFTTTVFPVAKTRKQPASTVIRTDKEKVACVYVMDSIQRPAPGSSRGKPGGYMGTYLRELGHSKSLNVDNFTEPFNVPDNFVFLYTDFCCCLCKLPKS